MLKAFALLLPGVFIACDGDSTDDAGGAGGATTSTMTSVTGPGSGGGGAMGSSSSGTTVTSTGAGAGSPGCGNAETAGTTNETLMVGGVERTYVLSIPATVSGSIPVPIVFGFHGFGGTGEGASQYFGLTGDAPAYYVYPQALPLPDQNGGVGWDMESDGVDIAFVDALIADLGAKHCVDFTRMFAAGHSHGASFSNHLGCYRPNLIRGIAPVAGGGPWSAHCIAGGISAMLSHGALDDQVPIGTGRESLNHWLEAAGCSDMTSAPVSPAPCVEYEGCGKKIRWCEHAGGHEWPAFAGAGIRAYFFSL